jgi:hypothetical protein
MRLCRSVPSNQIRRRRRFSVFSVNSSFVLCIPPFILTEVCLNYEHSGAAM